MHDLNVPDRGKVIKGIEKHLFEKFCSKNGEDCPYFHQPKDRSCVFEMLGDALALLKEQQPKTGHWKRTGRKNVYGGIEIVCSVCDNHVTVQNVDDELFCRHCGAEMNEAFNPVADT